MAYATNSGIFYGDSIVGYDWHGPLSQSVIFLDDQSTGGKGIVGGLDPNITDQYNNTIASRKSNCDFVILQGGVNDIKSFGITLEALKSGAESLIDAALALSGINTVFVWNIAPWKNHINWTEGRQTTTDDYNTWLAGIESSKGFVLVDMYSLLEDPVNADELNAAYDLGDGIHPNSVGEDIMRNHMLSVFNSNNIILESNVANTNYLWRGAVEPAETSASGNEIQTWRGAVEPAASSSADALIGGVARSLTRGLTRNVTEDWDWGA